MSDALESLNGLVVPLAEQSLLLPNVAVAELVGYRLSQAAEQGPAWFLGWTLWRDQRVPVIDPDVLMGHAEEPPQAPRALILNAVGESSGLSFIALRVHGIPRSKKVLRGEIDAAGLAREFISQPVRLADEADTLLIPDLAAIERALEQSGVLRA
ncbi:MAG: chemotaxis protein CheW [Pseudomonas sp.]